jgi:hypothetical protein
MRESRLTTYHNMKQGTLSINYLLLNSSDSSEWNDLFDEVLMTDTMKIYIYNWWNTQWWQRWDYPKIGIYIFNIYSM